jgi:hypothetical protein
MACGGMEVSADESLAAARNRPQFLERPFRTLVPIATTLPDSNTTCKFLKLQIIIFITDGLTDMFTQENFN